VNRLEVGKSIRIFKGRKSVEADYRVKLGLRLFHDIWVEWHGEEKG